MTKCPICEEEREGVGPKFIRNEYRDPVPPFTQRQLVALTKVMCEDCLKKVKSGEIILE